MPPAESGGLPRGPTRAAGRSHQYDGLESAQRAQRAALRLPTRRAGLRFFDMTEAYSKALRAMAAEAAREEGFTLEEGVYLATPGPSFETPAEIRAFRTLGATLVGMSTVPETIVARHMGIEVLGISCVTNLAAGLGATPLSHEEVQETGRMVESAAGRPCSSAWRRGSPRRWKQSRESTAERPSRTRSRGPDSAAALSAHRAGHCRLLRLGQNHAGQRTGPHAARPALPSRRLLSRSRPHAARRARAAELRRPGDD